MKYLDRSYGILGGLIAALLLMAAPLRADVVVLQNGRTLKGFAESSPGDPTKIRFTTETGTITIPRERIQSLVEEPLADGWVHIGRAYEAREDLAQAMRAYTTALENDPDHEAARTGVDRIQAMLDKEREQTREQALRRIDTIINEAKTLIARRQFEQVEQLLIEANDLLPDDGQREELKLFISEMYLAWAEERLDMFDERTAEEKLYLAYAANPENEQVVEKLARLWEDSPENRDQAAAIYENQLERHPEDKVLRQKLGDLYYDLNRPEDALRHYLKLYQADPERYQDHSLQTRLASVLNQMHKEMAKENDYDQAIYYYKLLTTVDPEADPTGVYDYEFKKRRMAIGDDDVEAQLELAAYAEEVGLTGEAKALYRTLMAYDATRQAALAGLTRMASQELQEVQALFQKGNFNMVELLGTRLIEDYAEVESLREPVAQMVGQARALRQQQQRQMRDQAQEWIKQGDEFYEQANFHFNNLFSTERRDIPDLTNSSAEAKKYYSFAIEAYEQALKADPSLARQARLPFVVKLNDSRERLRRLTQKPRNYSNYRPQLNVE